MGGFTREKQGKKAQSNEYQFYVWHVGLVNVVKSNTKITQLII
jgi:hypothetical protein